MIHSRSSQKLLSSRSCSNWVVGTHNCPKLPGTACMLFMDFHLCSRVISKTVHCFFCESFLADVSYRSYIRPMPFGQGELDQMMTMPQRPDWDCSASPGFLLHFVRSAFVCLIWGKQAGSKICSLYRTCQMAWVPNAEVHGSPGQPHQLATVHQEIGLQ